MRSRLPIIAFFMAAVFVGAAVFTGCGERGSRATAAKSSKAKKKKPKPKKTDDDDSKPWGTPASTAAAGKPLVAGAPLAVRPASGSFSSGPPSGAHFGGGGGGPFTSGSLAQSRSQTDYLTNETATDRLGWEIVDGLEDRPTLAIWLFDCTPSASVQRMSVTRRLQDVLKGFDELKKQGHKAFESKDDSPRLLTAIAAFGKTCDILTPEPTDDTAALTEALAGIKEEADGGEMTFAAIDKVVQEYLKYRTEKKRLIMLMVVTDEMGDDPEKVDPLVPILEKYAIPAYVIGVPAPFGREGTLAGSAAVEVGKPINVGPESFAKEMIDLDFRNMTRGSDQIDSGFGPFALSRLAKLSGGSYLIVRGGASGRHFDSKVMAKYAPDYVSKAEYEKLLAENKCRMALHNAAMVEPVDVNNGINLNLTFVRQDEAKLKVSCDLAQHPVARVIPKLDPLYKALSPGESDRGKLTGVRWQAAYDVAMGRVLAARAKYEGYNTMVAQLKLGKRPGGPNDSIWTMVPADSFSSDSSMDKMVKQSRKYLERVVKEHPGTPWEMMATRELGSPCGWEWTAR